MGAGPVVAGATEHGYRADAGAGRRSGRRRRSRRRLPRALLQRCGRLPALFARRARRRAQGRRLGGGHHRHRCAPHPRAGTPVVQDPLDPLRELEPATCRPWRATLLGRPGAGPPPPPEPPPPPPPTPPPPTPPPTPN